MSHSSDNRLKWACRRGMLELDLVLLPFFDERFPHLNTAEQHLFEELLGEADQDLYAWLLAYKPCHQERFISLLSQIRTHAERHLTA